MPRIDNNKYFGPVMRGTIMPEYVNDSAFEAAAGGAGEENNRFWDSTSKKIREHNGSTWRYLLDDIIDYDKTVVSGSPSLSNWNLAIDEFANKLILAGESKISFSEGTWALGNTSRDDIITSNNTYLLFEGDTRTDVGFMFVHGATPQLNSTNVGVGQVTLNSSGNNITVTRSSSNPNFSSAGIVNGDSVSVYTAGSGESIFTVDSVSGNIITLTSSAPSSMNSLGSSLTLLPNRILGNGTGSFYFNGNNARLFFKGWRLDDPIGMGFFGLDNQNNTIYLQNCTMYNNGGITTSGTLYFGHPDSFTPSYSSIIGAIQDVRSSSQIYALGIGMHNSSFYASTSGSFIYMKQCYGARSGSNGVIYVFDGASAYGEDLKFYMNATGVRSGHGGRISLQTATFNRESGDVLGSGLYAENGGKIYIRTGDIRYYTSGAYAIDGGIVIVDSSTLLGNTSNFNPTAGALGNNAAFNVST